MRGGDQYLVLIRKTEPKPIRVFLQDGYNDAWNPLFSNWYTSNLAMEAALSFASYEVAHSWGNGGHDGKQASAIFPDVMPWLWKGWRQKVQNGKTNNNMLSSILLDGETWEPVNDSLKQAVRRATLGWQVWFHCSLIQQQHDRTFKKFYRMRKQCPGAIREAGLQSASSSDDKHRAAF